MIIIKKNYNHYYDKLKYLFIFNIKKIEFIYIYKTLLNEIITQININIMSFNQENNQFFYQ